MLWAIRKHPKVAVKSGNTVGKSFLAADVAMDWLTTRQPSRVITTAPTFSQVEGIIWKEIRDYCFKSKIPLGGEVLTTQLKFRDDWFAEGISTNDVARFQGRHSENLLVILDEASGVAPEIWETVDALHPKCVLAIGNPLDNTGNFFECFGSRHWHNITISCIECVLWQKENGRINGLVTHEWIDQMADMHGVKSPWYQSHVLGEFPDEGIDTLISRKWVEDARKRKLDEQAGDNPRLLAADVATKHGSNETVIGYRYGHTIAEMKGYLRIPLTDTADKLSWQYSKKEANVIAIDSDGVGEGVGDMLISRRLPVGEFHGGSAQKAVDAAKFKNLRTQFYWVVAKKFEKGLYDLSKLEEREYQILKNQLCSIKAKKEDPLGRFQIETKEDMLTRDVQSPDYADTFMMLEWAHWMHRFADMKPMSYR